MNIWDSEGFANLLRKYVKVYEGDGKPSARELSLAAGVNHGAVSNILGGGRPDATTCSKLALHLGLPETYLLWLGGWMQTPPDHNDFARAVATQMQGLTQEQRMHLLDMIRLWRSQQVGR